VKAAKIRKRMNPMGKRGVTYKFHSKKYRGREEKAEGGGGAKGCSV